MAKKPNLIVILVDDVRFDAIVEKELEDYTDMAGTIGIRR